VSEKGGVCKVRYDSNRWPIDKIGNLQTDSGASDVLAVCRRSRQSYTATPESIKMTVDSSGL